MEKLRSESFDGYMLTIYDTYKTDRFGKCILAYEFLDKNGEILFSGEDFSCSPLHAIDSDQTIRSLLTFLTLRPGDTDADYFANYTEKQLEFANSYDCECLQLYTVEK